MISKSLASFCCLVLYIGWSSAQRSDPLSIAIALNASRNAQPLHKLIQNIVYEAKFSTTERRIEPHVPAKLNLSEPCKSHYDFYNQALQSTQTWALSMLDSSTKFPPPSILQGALTHLGNFDECIDIRNIKWNETSSFHGQHCLVTYKFKNKTSSTRGAMEEVLMASSLKMAICVPSTCNTMDTAIISKDQFSSYEMYLNLLDVELEVDVTEQDCHTADRPEFSSEDMIAAALLSVFAGLVIFSTCYDIFTKENDSRSNLPIAFSVYTNGKKLLNTSSSSTDTLNCLPGIRFLSMAWIILGHRYESLASLPSMNLVMYMKDFFPSWKGTFIICSLYSVDTFFVLSGLMVAYVFLRTVHKTNSFNILMYYIHRYVRLTPAFAIIIMLRATLLTHSGSGPIWDVTASTEKNYCVDYWWTNFLYVQNYVNPHKMCIGQSWYLAVDMQLYWLSPLLLVPLWKWPKVGLAIVALLTIGGSISVSLLYYYGEYPTSYYDIMRSPRMEDYYEYIYFPSHTRYVPYVIGIGLGYLLVDIKRKERKVRFSKVVNLALWIITAGLLIGVSAVTKKFQQENFVPNDAELIANITTNRLMWSLGVAMVIFLCSTGNGYFVNTILSWDWFQLLSKLTYSAYLVHISVQISQNGSVRTLAFLDDMIAIPQFLGDLIISLVFAVMLCLVFESPFIILSKELIGGHKPASKAAALSASPNDNRTGVGFQEKTAEIATISSSEEKTEMNDLQEDVPKIPASM